MLCKPQIVFFQAQLLRILGCESSSLFYIGGSDPLPPPLKKEQEDEAIAALERGEEAARQLLIERRESRGSDLHRHDRAHQGGEHLSVRQEHQAGDLCLTLY